MDLNMIIVHRSNQLYRTNYATNIIIVMLKYCQNITIAKFA